MAMIKRLYDEMHDEVTAVVQESWDNAIGEIDNIRNLKQYMISSQNNSITAGIYN